MRGWAAVAAGSGLLLAALTAASAAGVPMEVSCYADGIVCPGDCDEHVTFHRSHNGVNAYVPGTRAQPVPCTKGAPCTICFSASQTDCVTATFRGAGPAPGTFAVTPAFAAATCFEPGSLVVRASVAPGLRPFCEGLASDASGLRERTSCIAHPNDPACAATMAAADRAKVEDRVAYDFCRREGERDYNAGRPLRAQRRNDCAYSRDQRRHGNHVWRELLPASCPDGQYVSPSGLGCCSADVVQSACVADCDAYFK